MTDLGRDTTPKAAVYYSGIYWNDYELVRQEINRRVSGDGTLNWHRHFLRAQNGRKFKKALFVNCGNGWVERDMYRTGLFEEAVGVDYLQPFLDEAAAQARLSNMPFRYYQLDINTGAIPEVGYDLIVNHAACHHISHLDRVLRLLCTLLADDGLFVNFDYVGPHRNQYPYEQWSELNYINETLPKFLRQDMAYPHLPTMLATDPTEAIHSELILSHTRRYFDFVEHSHAGGAIAYPLITHNMRIKEAPSDVRDHWISYILQMDADYTQRHPRSSLFDYFSCRPNKSVLQDVELLHSYHQEETRREETARQNGGLYFPLGVMQQLLLQIERLSQENSQLRSAAASHKP